VLNKSQRFFDNLSPSKAGPNARPLAPITAKAS
jgi:hypothetical protein